MTETFHPAWLSAALLGLAVATGPAAARDMIRRVPEVGQPTPAPEPVPARPAEVDRSRPAERGQLVVMVDRAKIIRLPERTQTVVIGNPAIADMAIQKNGVVVVTGKSYGTTNLIAMDSTGNILAESIVSVAAPNDAVVTVQRGLDRQSYSCTPSCQPSVTLGDAATYFSDNRGQADARNQFATSR